SPMQCRRAELTQRVGVGAALEQRLHGLYVAFHRSVGQSGVAAYGSRSSANAGQQCNHRQPPSTQSRFPAGNSRFPVEKYSTHPSSITLLLSVAGLAWHPIHRHHYRENKVRHPNSDATPEGLDVSTDRRGVLGAGLALAAGTLLGTAREGRAADAPPSPPAMPAAADATPVDLKLLPGFKVERVKTSGAELHTVVGGSGPPLLLIHGAPLTHLSWFRVAPELAKKYTVIAADLRGYGDSSKPADGDKHINYSKRAMATDKVELMRHFGF